MFTDLLTDLLTDWQSRYAIASKNSGQQFTCLESNTAQTLHPKTYELPTTI